MLLYVRALFHSKAESVQYFKAKANSYHYEQNLGKSEEEKS